MPNCGNCKMNHKKLIGIYDPYLDTMGGGERYSLAVARYFLSKGYHVNIFWSDPKFNPIIEAKKRFGFDLSKCHIMPDIITHSSILSKFFSTSVYDCIFYLSDGSIPFLFSKSKIIHIQVPFSTRLNIFQRLLVKAKLFARSSVIVNSRFTKRYIDKNYGTNSEVLYPPVDIDIYKPSSKENIILTVGRFDNILNKKNQHILIDSFKRLLSDGYSSWKLILVGGSVSNSNQYLQKLKDASRGYPIEFFVNCNFGTLKNLYSKAKIYWHAAGFGVDDNIHPEQTEHFGITLVEAMASKCVPLAPVSGGMVEIITSDKNGYLYKSIDELISFTKHLIDNPTKMSKIQKHAFDSSSRFSVVQFERSLSDIKLYI